MAGVALDLTRTIPKTNNLACLFSQDFSATENWKCTLFQNDHISAMLEPIFQTLPVRAVYVADTRKACPPRPTTTSHTTSMSLAIEKLSLPVARLMVNRFGNAKALNFSTTPTPSRFVFGRPSGRQKGRSLESGIATNCTARDARSKSVSVDLIHLRSIFDYFNHMKGNEGIIGEL